MGADYDWVASAMTDSVPWVATNGIEFVEIEATRVVCSLPDEPGQRNHIGGPHAAMMFGVAETASGAVGLAAFVGQMDRATPLVVDSEIHYRKRALGALTAEAELGRDAADVVAELDVGKRPEFPVHCTIRDGAGNTTGEMTVRWTLRPNKS